MWGGRLVVAFGEDTVAKISFEVEPDEIRTVDKYSFLVTSPVRSRDTWHAKKFYRTGVLAYQMVCKRELMPYEIELFGQSSRLMSRHPSDRLSCQ